jgi:hypothetical protein
MARGHPGHARLGDEVEYLLEGRDSRRPRVSRVWRTASAEPAPPSRSPDDGFFNPCDFVRACPVPSSSMSGA